MLRSLIRIRMCPSRSNESLFQIWSRSDAWKLRYDQFNFVKYDVGEIKGSAKANQLKLLAVNDNRHCCAYSKAAQSPSYPAPSLWGELALPPTPCSRLSVSLGYLTLWLQHDSGIRGNSGAG